MGYWSTGFFNSVFSAYIHLQNFFVIFAGVFVSGILALLITCRFSVCTFYCEKSGELQVLAYCRRYDLEELSNNSPDSQLIMWISRFIRFGIKVPYVANNALNLQCYSKETRTVKHTISKCLYFPKNTQTNSKISPARERDSILLSLIVTVLFKTTQINYI